MEGESASKAFSAMVAVHWRRITAMVIRRLLLSRVRQSRFQRAESFAGLGFFRKPHDDRFVTLLGGILPLGRFTEQAQASSGSGHHFSSSATFRPRGRRVSGHWQSSP